jgi:hypothetical protein
MGKAGRQTERGKRGGKDNLNLLRGITRDVRDEDNLVARVLKVRLEKEAGGDQFGSLKVFPPKWWN